MVVKTDKDNKMTGYVMAAIKNKHLAVDNSESYDILLEYFKMIGERLDKMQEDFKNSEFDTEVKKKALSKFNQFNKSVYYSVITNKFYVGQFKDVVYKDSHISNSSRYFYHTLDRILYVGDIKISSKLVGDEIIPGSDLAHYVKSKDKLVSHLKSKFEKNLEKHKTTELEYISGVPDNTTTFRNKLKDISKRMTSFTNDFARLTIKNYCIENYK